MANSDKRIVYENDEVGVHHAFVTFNDGNVEAVMALNKYKEGKIASLVGASTGGIFSNVRLEPSSIVSSVNALENIAKNILSRPIEVSTTYGT